MAWYQKDDTQLPKSIVAKIYDELGQNEENIPP